MSSSGMASSIAFRLLHEIKNHLATMKVLTALIEPAAREKPYHRYLELLEGEIGSIEKILHWDVDLHQRKYVSVNGLLEELKELFSCKTQDKEITIEHLFSADPYLWCNPDLLKDAFYNVWQNAVEAMGDKGTLTIKVWESRDDAQRPCVCVSFSDTGPGVPKELITWLPRPFFTTKKNGLGLGLCVAHAVAAHHEGSMDIQSDEKGATVTFSLPLNSQVN